MKKQIEDYGARLKEAHEQWEYLYTIGGSDPFYADGGNLNLVRNHISYYRKMLEENPTLLGFPDIYHKEIPPVVPHSYMARPDEIRKNAIAALEKYKTDPNYIYILQHYNDFSPKTREKLSIDNVIGYATGLEYYIENDMLVDMRRHEHYERYLESFENCASKMQNTKTESFQLTFFTPTSFHKSNLNESLFEDEEEMDSDMEME